MHGLAPSVSIQRVVLLGAGGDRRGNVPPGTTRFYPKGPVWGQEPSSPAGAINSLAPSFAMKRIVLGWWETGANRAPTGRRAGLAPSFSTQRIIVESIVLSSLGRLGIDQKSHWDRPTRSQFGLVGCRLQSDC